MQLTDAEALSFDCYGTLIDWETGISRVLRRWADANGIELTDEELLTSFSDLATRAEAERPTDLYPQILSSSMRALGAQLGTPVTDDDALGASVPDWPAFPDSAEALQRQRALVEDRDVMAAAGLPSVPEVLRVDDAWRAAFLGSVEPLPAVDLPPYVSFVSPMRLL